MSKLKKILSGIIDRKERPRPPRLNTTHTTSWFIDVPSPSTDMTAPLIDATSPSTHTNNTTSSASDNRIVQNFRLVWLDSSIDEVNNKDCINTITQLREVVNTVKKFTNVNECIEFMKNIEYEKIFLIISGTLGEKTVPDVHHMTQVICIYIFCHDKVRHEQWAQEWSKVRGAFTDIIPIYEALKQAAHDCDHNSVSLSFVKVADGASHENLDHLDQSFMYTQILKEILLTIDFQEVHINEFLTYCREQFAGNTIELQNIDSFQKDYRRHSPIWWYTCQCFLYPMLNRALRTMEVDLIIKMGFFVRHLHENIEALHLDQYSGQNNSNCFTVYRGQGLSQTDFDRLKPTQGGLLSFNNFLSTSKNRNISFKFARRTTTTSDLVGVLFVMKIDPSISATPFANVENVSNYPGEEEILFSMHSVFRIGQMQQIDNNDRLWQVNLVLTADNDPQLSALTERMRVETYPDMKGWYRLGNLLVKLGQFDKAQQVFDIILDQTTAQHVKAHIYNMLGMVKTRQEKYTEAIEFYEKVIKIDQETLPVNYLNLATSYNNIGLVYNKMGQYSEALLYHEEAHEIYQKTFRENHPEVATSYNNIGSVYSNMGEYSEALSNYEIALEIYQKTLPENHLNLAACYNNIGSVYSKMRERSKAHFYYEKAGQIKQKTLPANHPDLASSYRNRSTLP